MGRRSEGCAWPGGSGQLNTRAYFRRYFSERTRRKSRWKIFVQFQASFTVLAGLSEAVRASIFARRARYLVLLFAQRGSFRQRRGT